MSERRGVYRITFRLEWGPIPAGVRLRKLLKGMLRGYGFRCLLYEDLTEEDAVSDEDLGRTKIPFGQHKGKPFDEIELRYLDWLIGQDWFAEKFPDLYRKLGRYLASPAIGRELDRELGED